MNWKSAREQCRALGGDLLSVQSEDENNAMRTLIGQTFPDDTNKQYWIGFGNNAEGWQWTDGSPGT